nr:RagB/SusD family nutrient uptake outer membrane protein [Pedobacter panaciterrae]
MKKITLISFFAITVIFSCKKDKITDPDVIRPDAKTLIASITSGLATADSVSSFTNALKSISLSANDVAEGLTVFAPLNTGLASNRVSRVGGVALKTGSKSGNAIAEGGPGSSVSITDSVLKDHIIKGLFKLTDLTNGKLLTSLSGKQLKVTRSADTIWINGIQIGGKQIIENSNEVVYAVKSLLSNTTVSDGLQTTSIEITVWDATKWSTTKPKGEVAVGASVMLYSTQKNYADSIAAYTQQSNAEGKAIFKSITPGTYYVKVSFNGKGNIFSRSATKQNGLYTGYASAGIFQTEAEIAAAPQQTGAAVGKIKWLDANQDGKVDSLDRVTLPYENAAAVNGILKKLEVTIGDATVIGGSMTEQQFTAGLLAAETDIAAWHKDLVLLDGVLSHDAEVDSLPAALQAKYRPIGNFSFGASSAAIAQIWESAYQQISALNTLEAKAPAALSRRLEKLARLKATRAYVYLQLTTYFGEVPLLENGKTDDLVRANKQAIYNFIAAELQSASDALPQTVSGQQDLNAFSVKSLLAKASLLDKNYAKTAEYTEAVINSGKYSIVLPAEIFSATSKEIIWNNSTNLNADVKRYFYNRPSLPYIRLAEIYFANAEANLALGNTTKAQASFSILIQRSGLQTTPVETSGLRAFWLREMKREGSSFANLLRWGTASQQLGRWGFNAAKNNLLPIPQSVLAKNPRITQNIGY